MGNNEKPSGLANKYLVSCSSPFLTSVTGSNPFHFTIEIKITMMCRRSMSMEYISFKIISGFEALSYLSIGDKPSQGMRNELCMRKESNLLI